MTVVDVGDVSLHVEDRGTGEPPLVLVHGYTGSTLDWADVHDALAERRRVVAHDHRGHGQSTDTGEPAGYTLDQLAADLAGLLAALDIERFHLLGHSMGGIAALRHVLDHPGEVCSLILMDTGARPFSDALAQALPPLVELGRSQGMSAVFELSRELVASSLRGDEGRRAELLGRIEAKYGQLDVEAFNALGIELGRFPSMVDRLGEISCPTTVFVGEGDTMLRPAADELAERIPDAELVVFAGAGHSPQEDDPSTWLAAVEAHLARATP